MLKVPTEHELVLNFMERSSDHPKFPNNVCCSWHDSLNQLVLSQQIPKIARGFAK